MLSKKHGAAAVLLVIGAVSLFAQNVTIDWSFQPNSTDYSKNFFNWTFGAKTVKDTVDMTSGASKLKSTAEFNAVRTENGQSNGKITIPAGLRGLMLYPLNKDNAKIDNLTFTPSGKDFVVRFVHRDAAYEITTINGILDLNKSFKIAKGVCDTKDNKFVVKPEFLKAGADAQKMESVDWTKLQLLPDVRNPTASRWYEGNLTLTYANSIFAIKGTLTEIKK